MCYDPKFGYTQGSGRWGLGGDQVTWTIDGRKYIINRGDYDCSSSVIKAWQKALEGTPYEGKLDGADSTRDMRSVFVNSGLFEVWDTYTTVAQRGDIYLNDLHHTAMCQSSGNPDTLSEFWLNDLNGIIGGRIGDQTGWESRIINYYNFPWNCTLHYNGKADVEIDNLDDAYKFLSEKTDASGRGKKANMRDRLAWMAKKQEDMQESINNLDAKVTTVLQTIK